ncbi:MAG: hypothetical protein ABIN36_02290 [Ferruginibacter sp.]
MKIKYFFVGLCFGECILVEEFLLLLFFFFAPLVRDVPLVQKRSPEKSGCSTKKDPTNPRLYGTGRDIQPDWRSSFVQQLCIVISTFKNCNEITVRQLYNIVG